MAARIAALMRDAAYAASRRAGPREAAPSRSSTPTRYLDARQFRVAPARRRCASAIRAHGIRNTPPAVDRARPAPSASPSPTTPPTASSRRIRWTYTRKKRRPTARCSEYARRGPRLAAVAGTDGRQRRQAAGGLRHRARDRRARPHADGGGGRAVRRHGDLQDGERARGLSVRGVPGPLPRGLGAGAQGDRHLPARTACSARCLSRRRPPDDAAGPRPVRARPPHPIDRRRRRWRWRRCAGRTAPKLVGGHARLDLHGRGAGASEFAVFVGHVENGGNHPFEVWVNGERDSRAASRALAKNAVDGHARQGPRLAAAEARQPRHARRAAPFNMPMPPDGKPRR